MATTKRRFQCLRNPVMSCHWCKLNIDREESGITIPSYDFFERDLFASNVITEKPW